MAHPLYKIEDAFANSFVGKVLSDRNGRRNVVPVFLDYPDIEEAHDLRYPSISILFDGLTPEVDLYDTQHDYDLEVNYQTSPPTFIKRRVGEYYRITYEVSTNSLSAWEDRELLRWVESRYTPRDSIEVEGVYYHVFRDNFSRSSEVDIDTVIYKNTITYSILADIEDTDNDRHEKGINKIDLESNIVKNQQIIDQDGAKTSIYVYNEVQSSQRAVDADKTLHRKFAFDDKNFWFKKK